MTVLCTSLYLWFHDFELTGSRVKAEDLFMLGYTRLHTCMVMWAYCDSHRGHVFKQTHLASARSVCNLAVYSTVDTHAERKHITYIELTDNGIGSEHAIRRLLEASEHD